MTTPQVSHLEIPGDEEPPVFGSPFETLLHHVCVTLGFCGRVIDDEPRHVWDFLPAEGQLRADVFVDCLLHAEGMDPAGDGACFRERLRADFIRHMGSDGVDAANLD